MLATFTKSGGAIQGFLFRPMLESLEDGTYSFEIERVDRDKRSLAANRLMFGAIVQELARWNREEGNGAALPASWWHERLKKECLHVIGQMRKGQSKLRRGKMSNGKVVTWREGKDPNVTSTTQLDTKEFSEYIRLACAVAKTRYGYPYEFDFLSQ